MRCVLVGADTLLLECAHSLLARGHAIVAIVTDSERVAAWALAHDVPVVDGSTPAEDWAPALRAAGVDHLFAITHLRLLPPSVLAIPRGRAINFHDGPLPEYAGLNTPVWGLLRGEQEWGVTWHLLAEGVDTGDVVVQRRFPVTARETSLSLNTVNVEHAVDTFGTLLDQLERGTLRPVPQPGDSPRREYRRRQRPAGLLDWSLAAAENDRLVRALHFGPHTNPVAAAVVWHPHGSFVVEEAEVADTAEPTQPVAPGTVVAVGDRWFDVACNPGVLRVSRLRSLSGEEAPVEAVVQRWRLAVGDVLPNLPAGEREAFAAAAVAALAEEATLLSALRAWSPAEFPWPSTVVATDPSAPRAAVTVPFPDGTSPAVAAAALGVVLTRLGRGSVQHVSVATQPANGATGDLFDTAWPVDLTVDTSAAPADVVAAMAATVRPRRPWLRDLVARTPGLAGAAHLADGLRLPLGLRIDQDSSPLLHCQLVLQPAGDGWELLHHPAAITAADATHFARCLALAATGLTGSGPAAGHHTVAGIALLDGRERDDVLFGRNDTAAAVTPGTVHQAITAQAARTPHAAAVSGDGRTLTYAELLTEATALAAELRDRGVGPDVLVGVHVERGPHLLVATLGVLLAGGAYVPLDPAYPADRLRHMIADSGAPVLVCEQRHLDALPLPATAAPATLVVDQRRDPVAAPLAEATTAPHHLAYCIYTSGSTGLPKGVLVEHRNVVNFFAAMDAVVPRTDHDGGQDRWFAVTSLSFDISVLELLYTLARGMHVVLHQPAERASVSAPRSPGAADARTGRMDFSLFYFSGDEAEDAHTGKYRLLLEGAKFADANGFCAVWTPERHFHAFGGLYPNPAITGAAVAAVTERVAIRAGSVVLPLHHPAEIAEAWSVVDNLSNGRVGVAFASGWQPNDFVFRPANYADAKQVMFDGIEQVRRLWRGERLTFEGPEGMAVELATLPRPVQAELPVWVTTAGNPETFAQAGAAGAHLLTHLLGQSVEQLAPKLAAYRAARAAAGHDPATGTVTLMLHTFVGDDDDAVRAAVREPLRNYLRTAFNLVRDYAWSFPTFQRPDGSKATHVADLADEEIANLAPAELDAVLEYAFQRYYDTSGLFGTPERVAPLVQELQRIGVDEIACLLDFGVANDQVLAALPQLAEVVRQWTPSESAATTPTASAHVDTRSLGEQLRDAAPTHFQCTPSMARLLTADPIGRAALARVPHVFVGGEALPPPLAAELREVVANGTVRNMYGPTETTIWSSSWPLQPGPDWVPIGTPLANNQLYVLGADLQPLPAGVAGDLWIGGDGVVRGYHGRRELTDQRFVTDPFRGAPHRMYFTGDLARWRRLDDGSTVMEFLGRSDHQVKLRGYRIELGEVESRLAAVDGVSEAVAVVRDDAGEPQLVAYVVGTPGHHLDPIAIRDHLRSELPEVMVPSHVVELKAMPHTPNGKIDRASLPAPRAAVRAGDAAAAPTTEIEHTVLAVWREVLAADAISVDDNFFDIGGHSLLVVRLHRALQPRLGHDVPLTDLYRFPTVRTFAASLTAGAAEEPVAISAALDRAARRRANLRGRS